jgi:hypothetical protein
MNYRLCRGAILSGHVRLVRTELTWTFIRLDYSSQMRQASRSGHSLRWGTRVDSTISSLIEAAERGSQSAAEALFAAL